MTDDGDGTTEPERPDEADLEYVADADDLDPGDRIIVDFRGREVAVFNVDGEFYALANYCVHQGGPACEGMISGTLAVDDDWELTYSREDQVIACPWHGWEFDITTGEHLTPTGYQLPSYEVVRRNGELYVRI